MKNRFKYALAAAVVGCASLLVGCAGAGGPQQVAPLTLQDPLTTPKEKWSDAMTVLLGDMEIYGQKDVPLEYALASGQGNAVGTPMSQRATLASGAKVLLTGGMFLVPSGQVSGPPQIDQAVAWVPADQADNMEEAIKVADSALNTARAKVFPELSQIKTPVSFLPDGDVRTYASFWDVFTKRPTPPTGGPIDAPSFLPEAKYYRPIYFNSFYLRHNRDCAANDVSELQGMEALSKAAPDWIAFSKPGRLAKLDDPSTGYPPSVFVKGQKLFFIGK
jgi:hypothetical protein